MDQPVSLAEVYCHDWGSSDVTHWTTISEIDQYNKVETGSEKNLTRKHNYSLHLPDSAVTISIVTVSQTGMNHEAK